MAEETHDIARANLRVAEEIERQSKWVVARLVACSIHIGSNGRPTTGELLHVKVSQKVGLGEGARLLRKHPDTVKAYMAAWNLAADDGLVIADDGLLPEDGHSAQIPDDPDGKLWEKYYRAAPERSVTNNSPNGVSHRARTEGAEYADTVMTDDLINNVSEEKKREVVAKFLNDSPAARHEAHRMLEDEKRRLQDAWEASRERDEADDKSTPGLFSLLIMSLRGLNRTAKDQVTRLDGVDVTDEQRDLLVEEVATLGLHQTNMLAALGATDWNAALANLEEER